jgi:hypothetical protein
MQSAPARDARMPVPSNPLSHLPPMIQMRGISKTFTDVIANENVDLDI